MKKTKVSKPVSVDDEDFEEEGVDVDIDEPEAGQKPIQTDLVSKFIRMWPRAIFDTPEIDGQKSSIASKIEELKKPGVYVLYRDDVPFYVGQAKKKLRSRLRSHASGVVSLKSYFWNYFSAYIVEEPSHIDEVEAILISAMPSVITNSAKPKLPMVPMRESTKKLMRELRKNR
jgi:hypothetical protein